MKASSPIVAALLLSGCATVTRGTTQDFVVESTPPGASVSTSNGFECAATPCTLRMPRKEGFTVTVEHDGYLAAQATVTSNLSSGGAAGMAGNVLVGGFIGMGVDATSGALNDLSPNPLQVTLQPAPAEEPAVELTVAEYLAVEPAAVEDAVTPDAASTSLLGPAPVDAAPPASIDAASPTPAPADAANTPAPAQDGEGQ